MAKRRTPKVEVETPEEFSRRVQEAEARVRKELPDIHPFDLHTIVCSVLRPRSTPRRIFLRRAANGGWIF